MYPLVSELAAADAPYQAPVAVTCRVLGPARQPSYRWLDKSVTGAELTEAYRADALFDAPRRSRVRAPRPSRRGPRHRRGNGAGGPRGGYAGTTAGGAPSANAGAAKRTPKPGHRSTMTWCRGRAEPVVVTDITEHAPGEGKLYPVRPQGRVLRPQSWAIPTTPG